MVVIEIGEIHFARRSARPRRRSPLVAVVNLRRRAHHRRSVVTSAGRFRSFVRRVVAAGIASALVRREDTREAEFEIRVHISTKGRPGAKSLTNTYVKFQN